MKEIKLKVSIQDGKQAVAIVDELGDGLRDLDVRNAREAAEAIESIGRGGNLKQTAKDAQALKQILENVDDDQLKEATDATEDLGSEAKQAADVYRDASGRMRDANGKFVKSASDAKKAVNSLGDEVESAAKKFDKLKDAGSKIESAGNKIQSVGEKLTVGITAPVVAASYAILKAGTDYESAMNMFGAVTNATADQMEAAAAKARDLGADNELAATSAKDAALAMTELAKGGLQAKDAMDAAKGTLQLAAAGQMDGAKAAEIQSNALNTFSLKASEATRVADLLAAAANASSAGVSDVAESMAQAGASFAAAKVPIEDLTTSIAIMANAGIKGSDAGTSLKTFLSSIQAPTDGAASAMNELGIKVFDAQGRFKGMPAVINDFSKALSGLTDEKKAQIIDTIFGSDASRAAQILFKNGVEGFNKTKEAVTEVGTAAKLSASLTKGLGGAWEAFGSQIETIAIDIFNNVKAPLTDLLNTGVVIVGQLGDAFSQLSPSTQTAILGFTAIAAVVGPVLVVIGVLLGYIAPLVSGLATFATAAASAGSATALISTGFATVSTFITATLLPALTAIAPIVLTVVGVIGVLAAAGAALYLAWTTNFGNIQGNIAVFTSQINEAFTGLMSVIQPAIDEVSKYITDSWRDLLAWWNANNKTLSQTAEKVWAVIIQVVQSALDGIKSFWESHGAQIKSIVSSVWEIVKAIIESVVKQIGNIIMLVVNIINGNWAGAWENFKSIVSTAVQTVWTILKNLVNIVYQAIKSTVIAMINLGAEFLQEGYRLGSFIIDGLRNGIKEKAANLYQAVTEVVTKVISIFRDVPQVKSPSRVTTEIGKNISEGLAVGIESKSSRVKSAAKKIADETIKALHEAIKEFDKIAGMSPQGVRRSIQTDEYSQATGDLKEIIKLRGKTATNLDQSLPTTISEISGELKNLQKILKDTEDRQAAFDKSLDALSQAHENLLDHLKNANEEFEKRKIAIEQNGAAEVLNLSKEIDLLGVTDDFEKQRIENAYSLKQLRLEMSNDGYGEDQIKEAEDLMRIENARLLELVKIKSEKQAQIDAAKEVADAQKKATEEAAKAMRETWENTRDFVRESLDIMTDDTLSFGEKVKSFFGNISDRIKESLLDRVSSSITTQILGFDPNESKNTVVGAVNKSNDYLKIIAGALTGESQSLFNGSSPHAAIGGGFFGGASSGGGGLLGTILGAIGGRSSSSITAETSEIQRTIGLLGGGTYTQESDSSSGGIFGNLKNLFSTKDGGLFAARKNILTGENSRMAGIIGGAGSIASLLGGIIGGKTGSVLSMAGTGAQIGAMFGPWGAGIGAGIGALVGLFTGGTRKQDEQTRTQAYLAVSAEFDKMIDALNSKPPTLQPSVARSQADSIISQYNSAMSQLKDSKTRGIALSEVTNKTGVIYRKNQLLEQAMKNALQWQVDDANRKKVSSSFIGEFAGGIYMDSSFKAQYDGFKRLNGLMLGVYTGRDYIKALIGDGEMVLNATQQMRVIQNARAGQDNPFADAGIPNVNKSMSVPPRFATGASFSPLSASSSSSSSTNSEPDIMNFEFDFSGLIEGIDKRVKVQMTSKHGKQIVFGHVKTIMNGGSSD